MNEIDTVAANVEHRGRLWGAERDPERRHRRELTQLRAARRAAERQRRRFR